MSEGTTNPEFEPTVLTTVLYNELYATRAEVTQMLADMSKGHQGRIDLRKENTTLRSEYAMVLAERDAMQLMLTQVGRERDAAIENVGELQTKLTDANVKLARWQTAWEEANEFGHVADGSPSHLAEERVLGLFRTVAAQQGKENE